MVTTMLGLSACSASAHTLSDQNIVGVTEHDGDSRRYILPLPEVESWRKHRMGLTQTARSCNLLEPDTLSETLVSRTASYDVLYELRAQEMETAFPFEGSSMFEVPTVGLGPEFPVSPHIIKRRRGGLIEQRDIIKAHEAHKMQSTPQAKRKEWDYWATASHVFIYWATASHVFSYWATASHVFSYWATASHVFSYWATASHVFSYWATASHVFSYWATASHVFSYWAIVPVLTNLI
ncbi:uncharacterized protein LOC122814177 [Protopterus annectens]|uniref:uncharacterized protein LOC122814177 n=1 Tax=Protopterus annectens TaxID=7888 RepID=UPI001CFBA0A0|nr:uncharacterized protein LOC122814177 [Protopterus annectens]